MLVLADHLPQTVIAEARRSFHDVVRGRSDALEQQPLARVGRDGAGCRDLRRVEQPFGRLEQARDGRGGMVAMRKRRGAFSKPSQRRVSVTSVRRPPGETAP